MSDKSHWQEQSWEWQGKYNDALNEIESLQARIAEQRWIPVSERLPEDDKSVLLYFPTDAHRVGYWHFASDQFRCPNQPKWLVPPTHWMPLPQPPEE